MAEFAVLRAKLARAGLCQEAADWVLKALSPASPLGCSCLIPDTSSTPVATPEYIDQVTVSYNGDANWDCLVLTPPSYPLTAIIVTAAAGFDFANTQWGPEETSGAAVTCMYTEPVTETAQADLSLLQVSFAVPIVQTAVTPSSFIPATLPLRWRHTYSSLTIYQVASDLANQGTVTSGQYQARKQPYAPCVIAAGSGEYAGNYNAYAFHGLEVPLSEAGMTMMNPKVRVAPAKTGVYLPLYCGGPTFAWALPSPQGAVFTNCGASTPPAIYINPGPLTSINQGTECGLIELLSPFDPASSRMQDNWYVPNLFPDATFPPVNVPWTYGTDSQMTGVTIFRGLDKSASLTLKSVVGLELVPSPDSPIRQFAVPSCGYEPRALQIYFEAVMDMPHAYPASANFLGMILAGLAALLPVIIPHVVPVISAIAGAIRGPPAPLAVNPRFQRENQPEMAGGRAVIARPRPPQIKIPARRVKVAARANTPRARRGPTKARAKGTPRRR